MKIKAGIRSPELPKALPPGTVEMLEEQAEVSQSRLERLDFSEVDAAGVLFEQVLVRHVGFFGAHLERMRLFDCRLEGCELSGVILEQARLRRVELSGCRMLGANLGEGMLEDVRFVECNLEGALFGMANFKAVRFEQCILKTASFESADLSGVVFERCDLTKADLRGAKLKGADFSSSTIDGMQIGLADLAGVIIAAHQAAQVVNLMGVVIKENLTSEI
jgi:uncharacterized protein YjbI with pentapeptide repeats